MKLDRFFQALFDKTGSKQELVDAGWIEHKPVEVDPHFDFYTTPLKTIQEAEETQVSVLFYPGCFAPVHEGHIKAMRLAKEAVEATGEKVVAGFFTPDHDNYIMRKTHDQRFIANNRITLLNDALAGEEAWMQTDTWASLYAPTDLNFTTLYDRLNAYMKQWVPDKEVKLYMVFGGDNYLFANSFTEHGYGVCIPRDGAVMDMERIRPEAQQRVIFSKEGCANYSSSAVRAANPGGLDLPGRSKLGKNYVLRDDLELALAENKTNMRTPVISDAIRILITGHVFHQDLVMHTIPIKEQLLRYPDKTNRISLDCFWEGEYNLAVTRLFTASGPQLHAGSYTNRPGTLSLAEQVAVIPKGEYVLVDDDIATGDTMAFVSNMLGTHEVDITTKETLIGSINQDLYDVVDLRDFVLGAEHGGLTIKTPSGGSTRMIYAAPYVNPITRAKILPDMAESFSKQVWLMNCSLYAGTGVTVAEIKENQDFTQFGFPEDMTVEEVCQKHLQLMSRTW